MKKTYLITNAFYKKVTFLLIVTFAAFATANAQSHNVSEHHSHETNRNPESRLTGTSSNEKKDFIGFFSFSIYKSGNDTRLALIEKKIVEGLVKAHTPYVKNSGTTLTADFYDQDEKVATVVIDHPLHSVHEVAQENSSTPETIVVDQDSTSFFIRIPIIRNVTSVRFTEMINMQSKQLPSIKL